MKKRKPKQRSRRRPEDQLIHIDDLRKAMIETDGPAFFRSLAEQAERDGRPPKPALPAGEPSDWIEAMFWTGICALPLWSVEGRWRFYLFCDGGVPVKDTRDDSFVGFDTYEEAIAEGRKWYQWKQAQR